MTIDWNAFSPVPAFVGGLLVGLAAAMLVLFNGRIAGISGIVGGLLRPARGDVVWRGAFVLGLVAAPAVFFWLPPRSSVRIDAAWPALAAAGLLVGLGTRYGSGCTSGHGVCGVSRLSPRSFAATIAFMVAGFLTVFVLRHLLGR